LSSKAAAESAYHFYSLGRAQDRREQAAWCAAWPIPTELAPTWPQVHLPHEPAHRQIDG